MKSKTIKIDTKRQLEELCSKLNDLNKRAKLVLVESGPAAAPAATQTPPAPAPAAATTPAPKKPAPAKTEPSVKNAVEQLNSIRGGKSFKDADVQQQLERYYASLTKSEQEALEAYLKGIAQIVSGQVDAAVAKDPEQVGIETTMSGKKVRTIKPNVVRRVKSVPVAAAASTPPKEDTRAPLPVVPKKR